MRFLLYTAFVLSGVAGLIYESIWSRYLGLFVGHSAYAQMIVLAIFLGGMAAGSFLAEMRTERIADPAVWYAGAELLIAIYGLLFHDLYGLVTELAYGVIFPALVRSGLLVVVKWSIAAVLILPPSVLLGTTFPLMSAGVLRRAPERPGHVLALLYFTNSLGAAFGVLFAGFYLIGFAGLPGTVLAAATLNLTAGGLAYLAARVHRIEALPGERSQGSPVSGPASSGDAAPLLTVSSARLGRVLLTVSFGTAAASFIYEISWIRMLSLALGSATHSFELMLSAFILGLALGALWVHRRADRFRDPVRALGLLQWLMGLAAMMTLPLYITSFDWVADLFRTLQPTAEGYRAFNLARYGVAIAIMVPASFFAGTTLPLITRILVTAGGGERAIGRVYGLNTLGSIVGAGLAGLVLLPALGLKRLLVTGAALDMALGIWLLASRPSRRRIPGPVLATALAGLVFVAWTGCAVHLDQARLTAGVFRTGRLPAEKEREVLFYRDGRTATVSVVRSLPDSTISIATNGKPDASLPAWWLRDPRPDEPVHGLSGDDATQALLALVSLAHAPDARTAAVIGQGSGMSSHFLLGSPRLEQLTTIDIEREMVNGSRLFYPANRRVFDDPRSVIVLDDAKSYFAAARKRFDIILSEPSNPWVSGVSGLFTEEFYRRVRSYLSEDGVFCQWLHFYEMTDGLVLSALAAMHRQFPSYAIYVLQDADALVVASTRPALPPPDWSVFQLPDIAEDLQGVVPFAAEQLDAMWLADRGVLAPVLDDWSQPNSDFYPVLDLGAEEARYRRRSAAGLLGLSQGRFDLAAALAGRRRDFGRSAAAPLSTLSRVQALSIGAALRAIRNGTDPDTARAGAALVAALYRLRRLETMLAADRPPADWRLWLADALTVEADLHGGTAGIADEEFYEAIRRYARRHGAPAEVLAAVSFSHGLAAWDYAEAASAAAPLLAAAERGVHWLSVEYLRDGATFARLATGDVDGARRAWEALRRLDRRTADDVRVRLVEALLQSRG